MVETFQQRVIFLVIFILNTSLISNSQNLLKEFENHVYWSFEETQDTCENIILSPLASTYQLCLETDILDSDQKNIHIVLDLNEGKIIQITLASLIYLPINSDSTQNTNLEFATYAFNDVDLPILLYAIGDEDSDYSLTLFKVKGENLLMPGFYETINSYQDVTSVEFDKKGLQIQTKYSLVSIVFKE